MSGQGDQILTWGFFWMDQFYANGSQQIHKLNHPFVWGLGPCLFQRLKRMRKLQVFPKNRGSSKSSNYVMVCMVAVVASTYPYFWIVLNPSVQHPSTMISQLYHVLSGLIPFIILYTHIFSLFNHFKSIKNGWCVLYTR
jgi:hypothetical protein